MGPSGRVTGIDVAPPFAAHVAPTLPDDVTLLIGDAARHPFDPDAFDAVISNFGLMFFDDTRAALANLRAATRDGGRLAATVWGPPEANPFFSLPQQVADRFLATRPPPAPDRPGPMRFGDPAGLLAALAAAGWAAEIDTRDLVLTPPGTPAALAERNMQNALKERLEEAAAPPKTRAALVEALRQTYHTLADGAAVHLPARIHVVTARAA